MASRRVQEMVEELRRCGYTVEPPAEDECPHKGDVSVSADLLRRRTRWHCYTCGASGEHETGKG